MGPRWMAVSFKSMKRVPRRRAAGAALVEAVEAAAVAEVEVGEVAAVAGAIEAETAAIAIAGVFRSAG